MDNRFAQDSSDAAALSSTTEVCGSRPPLFPGVPRTRHAGQRVLVRPDRKQTLPNAAGEPQGMALACPIRQPAGNGLPALWRPDGRSFRRGQETCAERGRCRARGGPQGMSFVYRKRHPRFATRSPDFNPQSIPVTIKRRAGVARSTTAKKRHPRQSSKEKVLTCTALRENRLF